MRALRCLCLCVLLVGLTLFGSFLATLATHAEAAEPHDSLTPSSTPLLPPLSPTQLFAAAAPECQRNLRPAATAPTLQISYTVHDSTGGTLANPVNISHLPYTVSYQAVITNTGSVDITQPTTFATAFTDYFTYLLYIEAGYGKAPKTTTHKINALKAGAIQTVTVTHTYTSGAESLFIGSIDPLCQQNIVHPPFSGVALTFLAPTADVIPVYVLPSYQSGPKPALISLVATDTFEVNLQLYNLGQHDPTDDLTVQFTSPLIGKPITAMIPVAQLPRAASPGSYILGDGTPVVFTAKTVTKPATIPLSATFSLPPGDTSKAKTRTTTLKIPLRPQGTDVGVYVLNTSDCPIRVGVNERLFLAIANYGSVDMPTGTTLQIIVDGKPSGVPIAVSAIPAATSVRISPDPTVTFTKAGKHTIWVVIDPTQSIPDYARANNTYTIIRYVLPV